MINDYKLSSIQLGIIMIIGWLLVGCSAVEVKTQSASSLLVNEKTSILTSSAVGQISRIHLGLINQSQEQCLTDLRHCLESIAALPSVSPEAMFATFSELYYAKALHRINKEDCRLIPLSSQSSDTSANTQPEDVIITTEHKDSVVHVIDFNLWFDDCANLYHRDLLQSVRYAYIYLFHNQQTSEQKLFDTRYVLTQDLYTLATAKLTDSLYQQYQYLLRQHTDRDTLTLAPTIGTNRTTVIKFSDMTLSLKSQAEKWQDITGIVPLYDRSFSGLKTSYRRSGVGSDFVVKTNNSFQKSIISTLKSSLPLLDKAVNLSNRKVAADTKTLSPPPNDASIAPVTKRIHPAAYLPATLMLKPVANTQDTAMSDKIATVSDKAPSDIQRYTPDIVNPNAHNSNSDTVSLIEYMRADIPLSNTIKALLLTPHHVLDIHDPLQDKNVTINQSPYPLSANFSASYGMWLADTSFEGAAYLNLLGTQGQINAPHLFMLGPFDPNKRVIIMLHGLASDPSTWINVTNEILGDAILRKNYQVWQIFYATNYPILENRHMIHRLITETYHQVDPKQTTIASKQGVLIGHSMGGVLGRLLLSDDNLTQNFNRLNSQDKQYGQKLVQQYPEQIAQRFHLSALPQIDTAVFLSTPFRGTQFADRWFTRTLRKIVGLPADFLAAVTQNLTSIITEGRLTDSALAALFLDNGPSQLSDQSSFVKLTKDVDINDNVSYHTIIANNVELPTTTEKEADADKANSADSATNDSLVSPSTPVSAESTSTSQSQQPVHTPDIPYAGVLHMTVANEQGYLPADPLLSEFASDGVVPYSSAHLDGADSETVINGGHSSQETNAALLTIQYILHQHLDEGAATP